MTLTQLFSTIFFHPRALLDIVVALVIIYLIHFIRKIWTLPPGPLPLPFIGNILQLRGAPQMYEKAITWTKKYGDPFTIWVGPRPMIIAGTKESFKDISGPLRNLVAGRIKSNWAKAHTLGNEDIVFSDFNPAWEILRRLTHVAIRKYAQTEKLAKLVAYHVDLEVDELFETLASNKSIINASARENMQSKTVSYEIVAYAENIIDNVLSVSTFGEGFQKADPDYENLRKATRTFEAEAPSGLPSDTLWILGFIFYKKERIALQKVAELRKVVNRMFEKAVDSYTSGSSRHFTDTLLNAREQFLAEDRTVARYLTDENLRQAVHGIFGAGIGTSRVILGFCFLTLANDPDLQEELREEIMVAIGTGVCISSDRVKLPKVDSFIQEVIRFFPAAPLSVTRKAMADCTINGRCLPKDSALLINLYSVNRDTEIWGPDANAFNPKRFLNANKDQLANGANSFSIGARSCPGEKMAQADFFYVIVRTLQRMRLSCPNGPGTADLRSINAMRSLQPRRQKLNFTQL